MVPVKYLMVMSGDGRVTIPAQTRARWGTRTVIVVDLGDRVVIRPASGDDPIQDLQGKYADRGPDTVAARKAARRDETAAKPRA
jgi:bifunctional DNA-binding transcriptional regulator/antitoxin component of YhaV-PrlF toxin-antitoxin module